MYKIKQDDYRVLIKDYGGEYCTIRISFYHPPLQGYLLRGKWIDLQSETHYKTLIDAKIKVFDLIESGELDRYIRNDYLPKFYKRIEDGEEEYWR